jgi:hypothetical protein
LCGKTPLVTPVLAELHACSEFSLDVCGDVSRPRNSREGDNRIPYGSKINLRKKSALQMEDGATGKTP